MKLKRYSDFLILENSNINPSRFRNASVEDIVDFVDQFLYGQKDIDITEKIAGQHLTVTIKNGEVGVNTKDQLRRGEQPRSSKLSGWGYDITNPLNDYLLHNKIPDQVWCFEILNPTMNHDYIAYKNVDIIYIEYTGNLSDEVADEIRKRLSSGVKLLTKKDIKININKNEAFENFKKTWESGLRNEFTNMSYRDDNKISSLKEMIGDLLDEVIVSVVDKVSPIEGVVIGTKSPIKLQTNKFLRIQRVQMPVYSLFKIRRSEIGVVLENPTLSFYEIKEKFNVRLSAIYRQNLQYSLYDTIKYYLEKNADLSDVDTSKYKRWLSTSESDELLKKLKPETTKDIYLEIYQKVNN